MGEEKSNENAKKPFDLEKTKQSIIKAVDVDGNGQIDIVDIIILSMKTPGIRVDRTSFLKKELFKNHPEEIVDTAIAKTPALAGLSSTEIDKIADDVINYERVFVSGISTALGVPGGWAMAATIPADIIQYYGYTLRATQKLLYLYGFPEIKVDDNGVLLDTETINEIILCLGIMNGVAGANNAIKGLAKAFAKGVEKKLLDAALTKGTFYPIVKAVMKWFGVKLTKEVFAGFFKKAIPVVGGVVGGGLTFFTFKPCCKRLKNVLNDTMLSNPDHHISSKEEDEYADKISSGEIVDVEFTETEPPSEPFDVDELDIDESDSEDDEDQE